MLVYRLKLSIWYPIKQRLYEKIRRKYHDSMIKSLLVKIWKELHPMGHHNVHRNSQGNSKQSPASPPLPTQIPKSVVETWVHVERRGARQEVGEQYMGRWDFLGSTCGRQADTSWCLEPACYAWQHRHLGHSTQLMKIMSFH